MACAPASVRPVVASPLPVSIEGDAAQRRRQKISQLRHTGL